MRLCAVFAVVAVAAGTADAFVAPLLSTRTSARSSSMLRMMAEPSKDKHVSIFQFMRPKAGKMGEVLPMLPKAVDAVSNAEYYSFFANDAKDTLFAREGYATAEAFARSSKDLESVTTPGGDRFVDTLKTACDFDVYICGPKEQLSAMKDDKGEWKNDAKWFDTDGGALWFDGREPASGTDTHVTIFPIFTVPEGRMADFKASFPEFYKRTKAGTENCLYYGFCVDEDNSMVICREGYANAEGVLQHIDDVGEPLGKALEIVGEGGVYLALMGPASELDKCRPAFDGLGTEYFPMDGPSGVWKK